MEEIDVVLIAKKSVKGIFSFISRSMFIQGVNFGRDIVLGILLGPAVYGVYYLVESLIAVLSYFSDIGLAGALIQKKENPTQEELATTFTIQQMLILTLVGIGFLFSSYISDFYRFPEEGKYLLLAFLFAFFLSSLKTIPSVLLERNLEFGKFVIPQIVETIAYTTIVIVLAYKGFGIASFTYAVLARGLCGLIVMYYIQPWKIQIGFSKQAFSRLVHYGIPFQVNSILALIKDNLLILFLGRILPLEQVGYIAFAQKWAFVPLRQVMDNIIRVTFSSFSRLQHDKKALGKAFEKSIFAGTALIFPSLVGLIILAPYLLIIIPKYQKWEPALLSLDFFAINAMLAAILVPLTNLLNAIGKIKITLYFMILWTIITWVATPLGILLYGFHAFSAVTAFINLSVFPIVAIAKKYVDFQVWRSIKAPLFSSLVMGVILYSLSSMAIYNLASFIIVSIIAGCIYCMILYSMSKEEIMADIRFIKENFTR